MKQIAPGRKRGVTIRRSVDCLIAACAIEVRTPSLHRDRDFDEITKSYCRDLLGVSLRLLE